MALNIPYSKGALSCNTTKIVNQFQYPWTEKRAKHHRERQGVSKSKVGMPLHESHHEEHSKQWGHQKQNYNQTAWQIYG